VKHPQNPVETCIEPKPQDSLVNRLLETAEFTPHLKSLLKEAANEISSLKSRIEVTADQTFYCSFCDVHFTGYQRFGCPSCRSNTHVTREA